MERATHAQKKEENKNKRLESQTVHIVAKERETRLTTPKV